MLTMSTSGENAAAEFRKVIESGGDTARAFALADTQLRALVAREQRLRWVRGILGGTLAVISGGAIIGEEATHASAQDRLSARALGGTGVVFGGALLAHALLIESPAERLTKIWRDDPSLVHFQPTVAASSKGVLMGVTGTF